MNMEQARLPSPSLSAATATTGSTTGSTQAPTSIDLRSYGISEEDENKWKEKYNRASIPLMRDDLFLRVLATTARDTDPATVEFESKLKSVMEQMSTDYRNEFNDQASAILLPGLALFGESQKLEFASILDDEPTIYGTWAFVARCLSTLVHDHPKHKAKRGPKQKKSAPPKLSKLSSDSIGKPSVPRSDRVKTPNVPSTRQAGRRSNRINKPNAPLTGQNGRQRAVASRN